MTIKVMLIDDSAVVRTILTSVLNEASGIEVIAAVQDPIFALKRLEKLKPDVIVLDVEMPRMDGLTFLRKIMSENPIPTVMCSTLTTEKSETSIQALSLGAVDVIGKPRIDMKNKLAENGAQIIAAVRNAANANLKCINKHQNIPRPIPPKLTADVLLSKAKSQFIACGANIVAIGTSTGGTQALEVLVPGLSVHCPGVVVVQHMPEAFTAPFARRLDSISTVRVKEGEHGELIDEGTVYIAPGGKHMMVDVTHRGQPYLQVKAGPSVSRHCPSVDVLFRSVSRSIGKNALGIIMTGMGDDGATGLLEMRESGARTIAQDEESCVIYGMPAVAVAKGAAQRQLPLEKLANEINTFGSRYPGK